MERYFKRQIELWGEDTQALLSKKSILIVGCGGLGSSIGYALGSSGIGDITIIDFDKVSLHNIHRQIAFELNDIDKYKADILAKKITKRYDKVNVNIIKEDFTKVNLSKKFDLILDATDNLQTRKDIDNFAKKTDTPWIYASVEEFHGQVCFFKNSSFNDIFNITEHIPKGIATPIVMLIASISSNYAIRYLTNQEVVFDELNYIFFEQGSLQIKKFTL